MAVNALYDATSASHADPIRGGGRQQVKEIEQIGENDACRPQERPAYQTVD